MFVCLCLTRRAEILPGASNTLPLCSLARTAPHGTLRCSNQRLSSLVSCDSWIRQGEQGWGQLGHPLNSLPPGQSRPQAFYLSTLGCLLELPSHHHPFPSLPHDPTLQGKKTKYYLFLFYRWGNWGPELTRDLSRVTKKSMARDQPSSSVSWLPARPVAYPIKYMNQMVFRQVIVSGVQPCRETGMTVSELLTAFQQTLRHNLSPFNRGYIVKASLSAWWANCSIELVQIPAVSESWVVYKIGCLGRSKRPRQGRQKQRTRVPSASAAEVSGHVNTRMYSWMAGWAQSVVGANTQLIQATHTCCWAKTSKEFRGR